MTLKLGFSNFWGLCSIFVDYLFLLESNSPDIFYSFDTGLYDAIDLTSAFETSFLNVICPLKLFYFGSSPPEVFL